MYVLSASLDEKAKPYVEALKAVGVPAEQVVVLKPEDPRGGIAAFGDAKALVLCGGVDVEPWRYGEEPRPETEVHPERDALEFALIEAARGARLPVFGVCRGLQVLNVFFGGSLWQDLPAQRPSTLNHSFDPTPDAIAHAAVAVGEEHPHPFARALARALQGDSAVNSRHHQAIKDLAAGLEVAATSADGLVEAFVRRDPDDWWVAGVQWHPENLIARSAQRSLWRSFVETAEEKALQRRGNDAREAS